MKRRENRQPSRAVIRRWVVGLCSLLAAVSAQAVDFDHLIAGKVVGGERLVGNYEAALTAADAVLSGTGCRVLGKPRLMLMPATVTLLPPIPVAHDPSVPSTALTAGDPDQRYVCYKIRCNASENAVVTSRDQFSTQDGMAFKKSGRLLCVPAVSGPPVTCGDAAAPTCNGECADPGEDCVHGPGGCSCVPYPGCGKSVEYPECTEIGNCPGSSVCAFVFAPGFCGCTAPTPTPTPLPTCESTSPPSCGGACAAGSHCGNVGGGNCGCIPDCGSQAAGECGGGGCDAGKTCLDDGGGCSCQ